MKTKKVFIILIIILALSNIQVLASTILKAHSYGYNVYTNNPYGYEIVLQNDLKLNEDMISIKSRFESNDTIVEILYDNFNNTLDNISTYNNYGNLGIKKNENFTVTNEYYHNFNNHKGYIVLYERKKLEYDEFDKNYYATIAFQRSGNEVITVFIKSTKPIYIDKTMPSFKLIEKKGNIKDDVVFEPTIKKFDEKTQEFYNKYFINSKNAVFGIFEPSFPMYGYRISQLENLFDYNFPVTLMYNNCSIPFKKEAMETAKQYGKVVEYTLYTTDVINGVEKDITLDILDGKYDTYLDAMAKGFNELDFPVLFRLNNEMNGAWVWYSSYFVGKDTDLYINCWRYIYEKFVENNVDNLIFVWNPNELSFPNFSYNSYLAYYPGNEYVDVVGLTAYNTGNYYSGETWRTFEEAYDHFYYEYTKKFKHPMMITEFSSSSTGGDKEKWFKDMFDKITKYDRIKVAVLWNGQDYDTTKPNKPVSRNYRIDLDENIIKTLKEGFKRVK